MNKDLVSEYLDDENLSERVRSQFSWMIIRFREIGYNENKILSIKEYKEFKNFLIKLKPNTKDIIWNYRFIIGEFVGWCIDKGYTNNKQLYQIIKSVDVDDIWTLTKYDAPIKFLNDKQFKQLLESIDKYEQQENKLYYITLFQAIYEGIYGKNLYEISELRVSDIKGNTVNLRHENGTETKLQISNELVCNLIELSNQQEWIKSGRGGSLYSHKLIGKYEDSCFKVVRKIDCVNEDNAIKNFYYHKIRKIYKEHLKSGIITKDIYYSGIINRIIKQMKSKNYNLEESLIHYRNKVDVNIYNIFADELKRVNCELNPSHFKNRILEYIDIIMEDKDLDLA